MALAQGVLESVVEREAAVRVAQGASSAAAPSAAGGIAWQAAVARKLVVAQAKISAAETHSLADTMGNARSQKFVMAEQQQPERRVGVCEDQLGCRGLTAGVVRHQGGSRRIAAGDCRGRTILPRIIRRKPRRQRDHRAVCTVAARDRGSNGAAVPRSGLRLER